MENDSCFADIILPVCTKHEMNDIGNDMSSGGFVSIYKVEQCIERRGESLTDFDVCAKVAEKLGPELL
jgi:anaerobic selenocysteine-containing dehydrogenase